MKNENEKLSVITFLLLLTDSLFFFIVLDRLSTYMAAEFVATLTIYRSLGMILSVLTTPFIMRIIGLRTILLSSSIVSVGCSIITFICFLVFNNLSSSAIFLLAVIQNMMLPLFNTSRECYSKSLGEQHEQRSLQRRLLESAYFSQIVGPGLSFLILNFTKSDHIYYISTFLFLVILSGFFYYFRHLRKNEIISGANSLKPFKYIFERANLPILEIVVLRTFLFFLPASMVNFLLFPLVTKSFSKPIFYSSLLYVCTGFGGWLGSKIQERFDRHILFDKDWKIAFWALFLIALGRLSMIFVNNIYVAGLLFILVGIPLSFNATSTQTIRRKLCTSRQHPEILGVEVLLGRATDFLTGNLTAVIITSGIISVGSLYAIGSLLYLTGSVWLIRSKSLHHL